MVERGGLENRCTRKRTEGSNPSPSANIQVWLRAGCREKSHGDAGDAVSGTKAAESGVAAK